MTAMIELRKAAEADIEWLCEVENANFSLPWTAETFRHMIADESCDVLIATADGERAGFLVLSRVLDEGSIDNVCTVPELRRRGAADALMDAALKLAGQHELALITLEVRSSNSGAIALYKKHNFETVGIRPGYYLQPREDAVIMTLYLKEEQP